MYFQRVETAFFTKNRTMPRLCLVLTEFAHSQCFYSVFGNTEPVQSLKRFCHDNVKRFWKNLTGSVQSVFQPVFRVCTDNVQSGRVNFLWTLLTCSRYLRGPPNIANYDDRKIREIPCVADKIFPKRLGRGVNTPPRQLNPEKHRLVTRRE